MEKNYEMRDEIEKIIKEQRIDRQKFYEVSKFQYENVLQKLYYSFFDYQKYPKMEIAYMWVRLRSNLKQTSPVFTNWENWNEYIDYLDCLIPENNSSLFYYLLVDGGWVYQGTLAAIKEVLYEYPIYMEDFYIFSKKYEWLIIHCEDGESMIKLW